jgi:outer membrane protein assembly factor BamA
MMVKVIRYIFLSLVIFFIAENTIAQSVILKINCVDSTSECILQTQSLKKNFSSVTACLSYVNQLPGMLQSKGYLSASVDSLVQNNVTVSVSFFLGKKYNWKNLFVAAKDRQLLHQLGIDSNSFQQQPFNPQIVFQLQEKLLDYFENNGFPFAVIQFDSVQFDNTDITANLNIKRGILYKLDSIRLGGNAKINKSFLYQYLTLSPGSAFNTAKHQIIDQKISELPYLQQLQPATISMLGNSYLIDLFLDNKKSNQVDAIVGFLPANQQLGGKLLFTVDAKINLQNVFASGETIGLNWQQIQPQSPRLHINYQQPYIFKSPLGLGFTFDLYKRDSSFLNINTAIGVQYNLGIKQKIKVLLQSNRTNLLDVDTLSVKLTRRLPDIIDLSINNIGIEYELVNTNYKFNPQKGNELKFLLTAGTKKIRPNNSIVQIKDPTFNYKKLYDSISENTYQFSIKLNAAQYFKIKKQSVLKIGMQAGLLQSPTIFRNEMFQIGGYRLLRGFDEESIFTNGYAVSTLEYRYLLGKNSYFAAFTDFGYSDNNITKISNNYVGGGLGFSVETKQGILNISFAAGKRNDLPFNLRQSKIHLGFVSLF